MNFNKHSNLEGAHAFLSPSKYNWIRYDEDRLTASYLSYLATAKGTADHAFASLCIQRKQKLPKNHNTLNMFVNDAIGFRMNSEQPLAYSYNCFGTADAISFYDNTLRIHDLKTGTKVIAKMDQLLVYAALFCLEYSKNPEDIRIELRIYQLDEVKIYEPDPEDVKAVMDKIVLFDALIDKLKAEE